MGKIEKNKRIKKERIFHAALDLFHTKGFHQTSISDIVNKAHLAKGTFYLYFRDKYDVKNQLVALEASRLFGEAHFALLETNITVFEDRIIFILNYIIEILRKEPSLMTFISKNLSWGVFKGALTSGTDPSNEDSIDFYTIYHQMLEASPHKFRNPEVLLFMIIELVGSTCHSVILYEEPMSIDEYKPFLYQTVRDMIKQQIILEENMDKK